jgi:hypothetical protein
MSKSNFGRCRSAETPGTMNGGFQRCIQLMRGMVSFNTQGMTMLGQVAELIQEVRADGATDKDLKPLFKSAEGYIRTWEKSDLRAAELFQ